VEPIVPLLGQVIYDATVYGWQVRKVIRSQRSEARYVTLRYGKREIIVRVTDHWRNPTRASDKWTHHVENLTQAADLRNELRSLRTVNEA
jgi:hypothetical protein